MGQHVQFQNQRKILIILFLLLLFTIAINSCYRHQLYSMGVEIIVAIQHHSNPVLNWFFLLITMTIDPLIVFVGVITMVVLSHRKAKGITMLCFILINTFFAALFKAYHCDPRPIWTRNQVRNIGFYCPVQYGNPSGHSWFSPILGFGVLLEYRGAGKNYRNILISILFVILVPMSRMYLGAHSLNQVLQGLIFGMFFCLMYVMGLNDKIHKFLSQFNHKRHWKVFIIALHVLSIVPFIKHMDEQLPQNWLTNIHTKCIKDMNEVKLNQLMLTVNTLMVNLLTGIAMGYQQMVKSPIGALYLTGRWAINSHKYGRIYGKIMYILVEVACLCVGFVFAFAMIYIHSSFVSGFIGLSIGGIISGYMFTTRTYKYLNKYQIIIKIYEKDLKPRDKQNRDVSIEGKKTENAETKKIK